MDDYGNLRAAIGTLMFFVGVLCSIWGARRLPRVRTVADELLAWTAVVAGMGLMIVGIYF